MDGSEVRCAHFPSVAYPTESDETTDPMGGRRRLLAQVLFEKGSSPEGEKILRALVVEDPDVRRPGGPRRGGLPPIGWIEEMSPSAKLRMQLLPSDCAVPPVPPLPPKVKLGRMMVG